MGDTLAADSAYKSGGGGEGGVKGKGRAGTLQVFIA